MLPQLDFDLRLISRDVKLCNLWKFPERQDCSLDDIRGRMIASHGIQGDLHAQGKAFIMCDKGAAWDAAELFASRQKTTQPPALQSGGG
jgi:hypothetical protein